MVANQDLFDAALRHQIAIRRLSTGEVKKILALLEEADRKLIARLKSRLGSRAPDLSSKRYLDMIQSIRKQRSALMAELKGRLREDLIDLAEIEADFEGKILSESLPVKIDLNSTPIDTLRALVVTQPFAASTGQAGNLANWFDGLKAVDQERIIGAIRMGIIQGETVDEIIRRVAGSRALAFRDGVLTITRRNAEAVVRTAINHVSNAAREAVLAANPEAVKFLRWTATLDGRTSSVCRGRDGALTPIGDHEIPSGLRRLRPEGARPPAHVNCRSVMVPILDAEQIAELMGDRPFVRDSRTRRFRERDFRAEAKEKAGAEWSRMTRQERTASVRSIRQRWAADNIGQVPAETTYGEWLKGQPAAFQDEVLGRTKARLFRKGGLTLDKFIDRRGTDLSIADLRKMEPEAFVRAGIQ